MRFRRSLRYRVGLALALFGGVTSLLLSAVLFLFFHQIEGRFVDDALDSEIEEFLARRAVDPQMPLPRTSLFRAYLRDEAQGFAFPQVLNQLGPGRHQLRLEEKTFRVAVVDQADERLYLLYDESGLLRRERRLLIVLAIGVGMMMLFSAAAGIWLAGRVISPVCQLGRRVRNLDPAGELPQFAQDYPADEVGELANTLENYLGRLHAFIERERNFTADASHELRTPLTIISGATEVLLSDERLPAATRARLERIMRAARDMRVIMEALLALARESDRHLEQGGCNLAKVVREVIEQYRPLGHGRSITLLGDATLTPQLHAQPALLAVAVGNLIRNALTHAQQGEVVVSLDPDRLIVDDEGPGFSRSAQTKVDHKGIGLSLVRRVCERYGWELRLTDRESGGGRVEIRFVPDSLTPDQLAHSVSA